MRDCISVIGLGKLGLPFAQMFASYGYRVFGVDFDKKKIEKIRKFAKNILVTTDIDQAVAQSSITFIVVQTPSESNGSFSLKFLNMACRDIGKSLRSKKEKHIVVVTSTVSPGSMEKISQVLEKNSGKKVGSQIGLCYSPEFIALGRVEKDLQNPNFILIGESDKASGQTISSIRKSICLNNPNILRTNFINAEIAKLALNTYLTFKMSFGNMIARICERVPGGDGEQVSRIVGSDPRVGEAYLTGSVAYGGPCFPRDNKALASFLKSVGLDASLPENVDEFNNSQNVYLYNLVKKCLKKDDVVGILGLAYKPGTSVYEQSAGKILAQRLIKSKIKVVAYDPAFDELSHELIKKIPIVSSLNKCLSASTVLVIVNPCPEFKNISAASMNHFKYVIDCWGILKNHPVLPVKYIKLGKYFETC